MDYDASKYSHTIRIMRKAPQQARSRALVARILTATAEILVDSGYDAVTTNRVAEQANVSPGSLYQYFHDKESLIDALVTERSAVLGETMSQALIERLDQSGPKLVHSVFSALLEILEENEALVRVIYEELPSRNHRERRDNFERKIADVLAAYLAGRSLIAQDRDLRTVAWILTNTLGTLAVRYTLDHPTINRETFLDEVTRLSWSYLDLPGS